jgi:hypothetical protein
MPGWPISQARLWQAVLQSHSAFLKDGVTHSPGSFGWPRRDWFTLGGHDFVKSVDWRLCLAEAVDQRIADFETPWIMEAGYTREIHEQTAWALRVGNDVDRADVLVASWRCAYEDSRIIVTPDPKYSR